MRGGRRPRPLVLGLAVLVIILAVTGVAVQQAVSGSLGRALTGAAVLGAILLSVIGLRKRST